VRKYNDLKKIQIDLDQSFNTSRQSISDGDTQQRLRRQANRTLKVVFMIMFRLSQNMESDSCYFSLEMYNNIVYSNQIFDMAKLFDICAIYGSSNPALVSSMMESIFANEPRFQQDFKEAFDMLLNSLKRIFKDALRTDQMIRGDAI
jgi:hypothetical protein